MADADLDQALRGLHDAEEQWRNEMCGRYGAASYEQAVERADALGLAFKGEFNPMVSYEEGDAVYWFGGIFRCRRGYGWRTEFYGPNNRDVEQATPIDVARRRDLWQQVV